MQAEFWGTVADWAQAVSSTVVLFLILLQMKQVNKQMVQNEDSDRFTRSWEFVKFYREQLKDIDRQVAPRFGAFDPLTAGKDSDDFRLFVASFYKPRIDLFVLLNQLIQHQQVDERLLYGYLECDFNKFIEIGVLYEGAQEFKAHIGAKINLLLTLWGSHIKSSNLLYGAPLSKT